MNSWIAAALFSAGILCLFFLNRDNTVQTSKALWIPFTWFLIAGSRTPSTWFLSPNVATDMYLEGNPFERNIFTILLLLAAIVLWARRKKVGEALRGNVPLLLFIFYCAVSLLWSDYPDVGFKRWTKLVGDLGMVLIVATDPEPSAAFDRLISGVGFLIVPLSILFIRYFPDLGRSYEYWSGTMHWTGVTTNKNALGEICMLIGLYSTWSIFQAFCHEKGKLRRLTVHVTILGMVIYLLHAADSATATSCFILGSLIIVGIRSFRFLRMPLFVHMLAIGVVAVAAGAAFFNLAGLVEQLGRNADLTGRTDLWAIVLRQPVSRIFGSGYESFWVGNRLVAIQQANSQFTNQSHDGYIEVLVNLGWIGVAFLALVICNGYVKITRAVHLDPEAHCLNLAYFIAALTYNFTEAAFKMTSPVWFCFVWAIVSASIVCRLQKSTDPALHSDLTFSNTEFQPSPVLIRH